MGNLVSYPIHIKEIAYRYYAIVLSYFDSDLLIIIFEHQLEIEYMANQNAINNN